jgi:hypothetical protein
MAIEQKIYKDDVGVLFKVNTLANLTTATKVELHVKKPSGTEVKWVGATTTDWRIIQYTSVTGDLDEVGDYLMYAYVEFTAASKHEGQVVTLPVLDEYQ